MATNFALTLHAARSLFDQTAADAYDQQLTEDELKRLVEQQNGALDQQWSVLAELASLGQEEAIIAPFEVLLCEWARKKGYQVILENFGMVFNLNDWVLIQKHFGEALQRKQQVLSSELRTILLQGRERREQAAWARSERLLPHAAQMLQEQHDQVIDWSQNAERILKDRENALWEGQAIAHEWAFLAQDSMVEQQRGLDSQYQFVESIHGNVAEMLRPAYQQELAYEAVSQYRAAQVGGRIGCILLGLTIAAVLVGLGIYLMFHIV